jgi:acetylglutamate kinase
MTVAARRVLTGQVQREFVPAVEGCPDAVNDGERTARVIDGRTRHSVLPQIFTDEGAGTVVVPDHDVSFEGAAA